MALVSIPKGNMKLNAGIGTFSLPPVMTCPNAGGCKKYCYAKKAYKLYPSTKKAWEKNLIATRKQYFADLMIDEIKDMDVKVFRIHVSGDFYSQAYFDRWCEIAENCPEVTFYTYTKSVHLKMEKRPKNLRVIVSMGGRKDIPIDKVKELGFTGYSYVTDDYDGKAKACDGKCGTNCSYCYVGKDFKIVNFKKH